MLRGATNYILQKFCTESMGRENENGTETALTRSAVSASNELLPNLLRFLLFLLDVVVASSHVMIVSS